VKAPSLLQELSSLYALAQGSPSPSGLVSPLRPERSTGVDLGLEQSALAGRVQVNVTWFDNHFRDLIEYVGAGSLAALGVSDAAAAAATFGAYVNAQSYRARGLETSASALLMPSLSVTASYTYLSTRVTQSFDSSALTPAINPDYPDELIGAYSPLVGGRPFRRPAHTGSVLVSYSAGRLDVSGRASMSGAYDDSTFLSDAYFGNSLLLPNHNLGASYRRLDASGSWRLTPAVTAYATVENLFDARYEAASGYPALGRTGIVGLRVGVGGDRSPSPTRED